MAVDVSDDVVKNLLKEFNTDVKENIPQKEPLKVYLRIRPLTVAERKQKEDQDCIIQKGNEVVELCAPPSSFTFKSSNRGFNDHKHQFSFSHVFPEVTSQKQFFDETMLPFVKDILDGQNGLVFTYGVTNSGKTYTIQGTPKDGGILPRALDVIFNSISKMKYMHPNMKPKNCHEIMYLSKALENKEELLRNSIFAYGEKENVDLSVIKKLNSTTKTDISVMSSKYNTFLSDISVIQKAGNSFDGIDIAEEVKARIVDDTNVDVDTPGNVKFAMWVSFMEIYNELIHDLLDLSPFGIGKKRPSLKLGDDKSGNPYVKGLTCVFVTSSNEAYKILRVGQRNRHMAATKLNQQSSRSHSIFTIKLLKIIDGDEPRVSRISRLSIVDLAGSERYCKTNAVDSQLKEASNINCSIMTLGKCINTLRFNQEHQFHPTIVPFRESKLTRMFQSFFLGKGKASMIVNISPCASLFDETYSVLKFSAVAKEIKMKAQRATDLWQGPLLPKVPCTPSNSKIPATPSTVKRIPLCIVTPMSAAKKERTLNDPTDFTYNELVSIVKELTEKVKRERKEKSEMEKTIREEVGHEVTEMMSEVDETHRNQLQDQKRNLQETMDQRLDLLTRTVEKQRKRRRLEDESEDESVPSIVFQAEKMKVKELEDNMIAFQTQIDHFKKENAKLIPLEKRVTEAEVYAKEAEETWKVQNESMKNMQQKLQDKNDEIEKMQEELDDTQRYTELNDLLAEKEEKILKMEESVQNVTKELAITKANLLNRDVHIKQLEATKDTEMERLQNEVQELKQKQKDSEENMNILQFECDERKTKIERYESLLGDHQATLTDSENIIAELNIQLSLLKSQLQFSAQFEENVVEVGVNTSISMDGFESSDLSYPGKKYNSAPEVAAINMNETDEMVNLKLERISSIDVGVSTPFQNVATEETGQVLQRSSSTKIGEHALSKLEKSPIDEVGVSTPFQNVATEEAGQVLQRSPSPKIGEHASSKLEKSPIDEVTTPIQKIPIQNAIESIEGFKLEPKSLTKALVNDIEPVKKEKYLQTPKSKHETPIRIRKGTQNGSSYLSSYSANLEQTIKQLETLVEEGKKTLEKKTSVLVTKNNRIQQLESQVDNLEKKNHMNTILEERSFLQEQVNTLTIQLNDLNEKFKEKNDQLSVTDNELQVWMKKTESYQTELHKMQSGYNELQKCRSAENEESLVCKKCKDLEMQYNEACVLKESLLESKADLLQKVSILEAKSTQIEVETHKMNSINMKQDMKIHVLEADIIAKEQGISQCNIEVDEANRKHDKLKGAFDKQLSELTELQRKEQKLLSEKDGYLQNITHLEQERAASQAIISSLQNESGEIKKEAARISSLNEEIHQIKEENEGYQKQINKYEMELVLKEETICENKTVKKENEELKTLYGDMKNQNDEFKNLLHEEKEDVKKLNLKVDELKGHIEKITLSEQELSEEIKKEVTDASSLTEELNCIKEENEDYQKQINKYKTEIALKEEYISENETVKKEKEELKSLHGDMIKQNNELKDSLHTQEEELKKLKRKMEKQNKEISRVTVEKQAALDELLALSLSEKNNSTRSTRSVRNTKSKKKDTKDKTAESSISQTSFPDLLQSTTHEDPKELSMANESEASIVQSVSIACSPLSFDDDQSTQTEGSTADITDIEKETPMKRTRKRLLVTKTPVFNDSPDDIVRNDTTADFTRDLTAEIGEKCRRTRKGRKFK